MVDQAATAMAPVACLLRQNGFRVIATLAWHPTVAEFVTTQRPDLAILGPSESGWSEYALALRLARRAPLSQVLLISPCCDALTWQRASRLGIGGIIDRTAGPTHILHAVSSLLCGHRQGSRCIVPSLSASGPRYFPSAVSLIS